MSDAATIDPTVRRREAGDFLRSRRQRLTPAEVGLPDGFRRRTPGGGRKNFQHRRRQELLRSRPLLLLLLLLLLLSLLLVK